MVFHLIPTHSPRPITFGASEAIDPQIALFAKPFNILDFMFYLVKADMVCLDETA
jgi:hypothetical protein